MTDVGVSAVAQGCSHLKAITLKGTMLTDAGVSALVTGCSQLVCIDLENCGQVTDACITELGDLCNVEE